MNKEEIMDKISEMENELAQLKEELNKQEEPKLGRWKPEYADKYYYLDSDGDIYDRKWTDDIVGKKKYKIGNVFKTQEEAQFAIEQLKVLAELKEYADDDKEWDNSSTHWSIQYTALNGYIEVGYYSNTLSVPFNIYFSSKEQAQKAIDVIGKGRLKKYYFCVED